jgi:hypothetical protein
MGLELPFGELCFLRGFLREKVSDERGEIRVYGSDFVLELFLRVESVFSTLEGRVGSGSYYSYSEGYMISR